MKPRCALCDRPMLNPAELKVARHLLRRLREAA